MVCRDIPLSMPLPAHPIASGLDDVRDAHLSWLRDHGLLPTDESADRYVRSRVGDIAAYCDPESQDMLLSYNAYGWIFLHDDWMDAATADRETDLAVIEELSNILHGFSAPSCPLTAAFVDLWKQLQTGTSEAWRHRMTWLWQQYFNGGLAESANRQEGRQLTRDEHLRVKDSSVTALVYSISERTNAFEVPAGIWHAAYLDTLRHHASRHITLVNDIHSFEQDEERAHTNLVSLVMKEERLTHDQALQKVAEEANRHIQAFCGASSEVSSFCDRMGLSGRSRNSVSRHIDTLRYWIRGSYDWYSITCRYAIE